MRDRSQLTSLEALLRDMNQRITYLERGPLGGVGGGGVAYAVAGFVDGQNWGTGTVTALQNSAGTFRGSGFTRLSATRTRADVAGDFTATLAAVRKFNASPGTYIVGRVSTFRGGALRFAQDVVATGQPWSNVVVPPVPVGVLVGDEFEFSVSIDGSATAATDARSFFAIVQMGGGGTTSVPTTLLAVPDAMSIPADLQAGSPVLVVETDTIWTEEGDTGMDLDTYLAGNDEHSEEGP